MPLSVGKGPVEKWKMLHGALSPSGSWRFCSCCSLLWRRTVVGLRTAAMEGSEKTHWPVQAEVYINALGPLQCSTELREERG
jgi:hypothetical protein